MQDNPSLLMRGVSVLIAVGLMTSSVFTILLNPLPALANDHLSALSDEELATMLEEDADAINGIGLIIDEAIVFDLTDQSTLSLRNRVDQLVTDGEVKPNLRALVDASRITLSNTELFIDNLDEHGASNMLNATSNILSAFISAVEANRGNKISEAVADELILAASQIIENATKRGRDLTPLIEGLNLPVSTETLDKSKLLMETIREVLAELELRGYDVEVDGVQINPWQIVITVVLLSQIVIGSAGIGVLATNAVDQALIEDGFAPLEPWEKLALVSMNSSLAALLSLATEPNKVRELVRDGGLMLAGRLSARDFAQAFITNVVVEEAILRLGLIDLEVELVLNWRGTYGNKIIGNTFIDADQNGFDDPNEGGIPDWNITLRNANGVMLKSQLTDIDGLYSFPGLTDGSYAVVAEVKTDWISTSDLSLDVQLGPDNREQTNVNFGFIQSGQPPPEPVVVFQENFDSGINGWTQSLCQIGSGQICELSTITSPSPVPSPPNWGYTGVRDTVPGCGGAVASGGTKTFSAPTTGNYEVSSAMFASPCDICNVLAKLLIDGQIVLVKSNTQGPSVQTATIPLTAGTHSAQMQMTSDIACSGSFRGQFDNVTIQTGSSVSILSSQAVLGDPYFTIVLDQSSATAIRPGIVTVELRVDWHDGYESEPMQVDLLIANGTSTGISHIVTSTHNGTTYQLFDVTFDISPEATTGQHQFFIFVRELDGEDHLTEFVILNVE